MIELKRLKLINWHNFENVTFDCARLTYMIGVNAVGKTTILDAIRYCLTTNRNFNALGNKKSGRTLQGSVHAKQRGENAYRRPGRTVAYIGAEFWDSVKRTHFVIAVRVESEGPMQELHPGDQTWYISEDGCTLEQLPFIDPRTGAPSSKENFKPAVGRLSYTRSPGEARDRICRALGIGRAASPLGKKFNEVFQMGTSMDEIPNFREFLYQYILPQPELDLEALQGDRVELENLHAVLAEAQTRAAALEQIVDYGREAAQKETEALVNRGTALLARAEEAAAGTNTWQEHLAAGKRQHEELTARYAAAKDAEAEARRAYLSAHSAAASGEGRALDALSEELARKKTALDKAGRDASRSETAAGKVQSLLQSLQRSGFAVEKSLWPASLTAETLPQLQSALAGLEKPLEEQYFAARQSADTLTAEVQEKQAELASVSGGRWVYPHGDAATRVRDAVNAELKSRGMTPDAKIFCELLSVEDESWQDCVEACLGDRRFDILVPPAHYAAAKDAEAEARRAYLSAHSAAASGEGRALDALSEELARKKTALDKAGRDASRSEAAAGNVQSLLQSLQRSGFAVERSLWPASLTAETLPQLQSALAGLEKPLEEQYFAARQSADALTAEVQEKQAELASVSGGRWVYPHGDAATRVRDAVNAELKSRGMTPDAKIFCELLSVEDESWQDCVEACLGDRRFDILVPPAHYAAAKSAFVALRDKVGPISLLDTPSIRTANRKADAAPADSLAAQVRSENPLAAQYADTILRRIVCCDTPDTLENYPDSATRDLLRHHPFRLERLRTPQRYIGLDARRARAEALTKALDELTARSREAAQSAAALKAARNSYQDVLHSSVMDELAALWDARAALEAARADCTAQEQKLAECRENPMLQQLYKEDEAREAAWDAARAAVETAGGDIRVCEKQLASCEAEQAKAEETARQAKDAADRFFAQYPLLEPLARERFAALSKDKGPRYAAQSAEKAQARLDDALAVYLTGTLEPAQKEYNTRYVCDHPLGLTGIEQYRAQHESLVRIDLERYAARLEQAQRDCKDRFRKDILFRMKDDIFNARRQFRELNKVMEQLTYGEEVYRFELGPSRDPQLAAFYQVIVDKGNQQMTDGDSLDNLAATADPVYERQVDELMEKIMADVDENTRARQEGRRPENVTLSDYVDYRTYLDYDIKVTNTVSGQQASLSRVSRDSSGGENQAPFYVAICASLLQIYQKSENSIRLVLLDEAFSKMTSDRIRPMMELFRRMQLQVLLISTVEKSTAIQPSCDITYSIVRHGDVNAIAPFYRLNASEEIGS